MIAIINTSKTVLTPDATCTYEIRIGSKVITRFRHKRSQGLAVCLHKAAKAVEVADFVALDQLVNALNEDAPRSGNGNGKLTHEATPRPSRAPRRRTSARAR